MNYLNDGIEGGFNGQLSIATKERQNQLTIIQKEELRISRYIGDTILYDRAFQNVYKGKLYDDTRYIYYNKEKGLIALETTDEYWVLTN